MKGIKTFIFIKDSEKGILSIGGGRAKSLVPVFGGNRIIDTYLNPLIRSGLSGITIIAGERAADVKDYIRYRYGSQDIEVADRTDVCVSFLSRLKHGEGMLVLQASGLLMVRWRFFLEFLLGLPRGTYHLKAGRKAIFGFYFLEGDGAHKVWEKTRERAEDNAGVDNAWKALRKALEKHSKPFSHTCSFFPLRTVSEYYRSHFEILANLGKFVEFEQLFPVEEVDEESLCSVSPSGYVRDSYLAHSCLVEGHVERSILFPHVRVGKNARVVDSIVMDYNNVGSAASVRKAILCDNSELFARITPNIGEGVKVGGGGIGGTNDLFPDLIGNGITLIGRNVEIPRGVAVSGNCYIASGIGKTAFRGLDVVSAGDSILAVEE